MLTNLELEKLEYKYLEKYYYFLKFSMDEILIGLNSKQKIKNDWFDIWNKDSNSKQSFSVGAERVIYYYISNSRILGEPNSNPVSSDLMFEVADAFVHIDLKTVQTSNIGDISTSIFIGNNQNSYKSNVDVGGKTLFYDKANLPKYYTFENTKKPCLTYFITILHDSDTLENMMINIMCMPNGQLEEVYGSSVLQAGKTKDNIDRDNNKLSTVRFKFSKNEYFKLLENKKRIKIAYLNDNIKNNDIYSSKLEHFIRIHSNQND